MLTGAGIRYEIRKSFQFSFSFSFWPVATAALGGFNFQPNRFSPDLLISRSEQNRLGWDPKPMMNHPLAGWRKLAHPTACAPSLQPCSHKSASLAASSRRILCSCSAVLALCCASKSCAQLCSCSAALLRSAGCALRSAFCACAQLRSCSAALLRSAGCALRSPFCACAQLRWCSAALALSCAQPSYQVGGAGPPHLTDMLQCGV